MKEDLTLPIELSHDKLTLEEIGAIFVLCTLPNLPKESKWFMDINFTNILDGLLSRGVLKEDDPAEEYTNIEIDLTVL